MNLILSFTYRQSVDVIKIKFFDRVQTFLVDFNNRRWNPVVELEKSKIFRKLKLQTFLNDFVLDLSFVFYLDGINCCRH